MTVDTMTLTAVINKCFELSMDGQLTAAQRSKFLAHGKRLRGHLMNLLSAQFTEGSEALTNANERLSEVNTERKDDAAVLSETTAMLSNIAKLAGTLDRLLNVAVAFI